MSEATEKLLLLTFLASSPEERVALYRAIQHNGIFCPECGHGSTEAPNPKCQCQNDE